MDTIEKIKQQIEHGRQELEKVENKPGPWTDGDGDMCNFWCGYIDGLEDLLKVLAGEEGK